MHPFKNVFVTALILISGLFAFTPLQAQDLSRETETRLNAIGDEMVKATLAGELLSLIDYYTEDAVVMPDFNPRISGKKELLAQYKLDIKKGLKYHAFSGTIEKRWRCGDEIFEQGTYGMAISAKESPKPVAYLGTDSSGNKTGGDYFTFMTIQVMSSSWGVRSRQRSPASTSFLMISSGGWPMSFPKCSCTRG